MKYSLGISNFLKEISSLSLSIVFLYFFALITEAGLEGHVWKQGAAGPVSTERRPFGGEFHAKMDTIKDRNGMDLTEAEDIKKRCKNTQNYTKKIFMTQITMMV